MKNCGSSGQGFLCQLHQAIRLRTGQPVGAGGSAVIYGDLDIRKQLRCILNLIDENRRRMQLQEHGRIGFGKPALLSSRLSIYIALPHIGQNTMHLYFSLYELQLCVSAQAFTIHAKVARFQIRRLSRRYLSFSPSKSVWIFFMIAHLITLIISSFTSSADFPAERSLLRKARSAPRNSCASSGDSSAIRFSALRRNICSTSIPLCLHCII